MTKAEEPTGKKRTRRSPKEAAYGRTFLLLAVRLGVAPEHVIPLAGLITLANKACWYQGHWEPPRPIHYLRLGEWVNRADPRKVEPLVGIPTRDLPTEEDWDDLVFEARYDWTYEGNELVPMAQPEGVVVDLDDDDDYAAVLTVALGRAVYVKTAEKLINDIEFGRRQFRHFKEQEPAAREPSDERPPEPA